MIQTTRIPSGFTPGEGFDPDDELNAPTLRDRASLLIDYDDTSVVVHIHRDDRKKKFRSYIYSRAEPARSQISAASLDRIYNLLYGRHWRVTRRRVTDFFSIF